MVSVLGVHVDANLLARWREWIAPERQPFLITSRRSGSEPSRREIGPELRDTYKLWRVDGPCDVLWLDEASFFAMPRPGRAELVRSQVTIGRGAVPVVRRWVDVLDPTALRQQADGHRFVWWPSMLPSGAEAILVRIVGDGERPSRHRNVEAATWRRCSTVLPRAEELAGSFPRASGPNCFGTVMGAAGVADATDEWMLKQPFKEWLRTRCRPGGSDDEPGTVLAWFDRHGTPVHAAVTIGRGWALEKASQCWSSPRVVIRVEDALRMNRSRGQRLQRHRIL